MLLEETPLANIWRLIAWPPKPLGNVDSQYRTVLSKLVRSPGLLLIKTTNCSKNSLQMKGLDRSHSDRLDTNDLIHQTVQMAAIPQCLLQPIQERLQGSNRDPIAAYATENRATHQFVSPAWSLSLHDEPSQYHRARRHSTRSDLSYSIDKCLPASTRCWPGNDTPWIRCKLYGAIFGFASTAYTTTTFLE